jgi:hypothetical protein
LSIPFTRKSESKKNGTFSKWRDLKGLKIWAFWKLIGFEHPNFCEVLLISQNRDSQPTVKFYRQHNARHIYRRRSRNMHLYVVWVRAQTITVNAESKFINTNAEPKYITVNAPEVGVGVQGGPSEAKSSRWLGLILKIYH